MGMGLLKRIREEIVLVWVPEQEDLGLDANLHHYKEIELIAAKAVAAGSTVFYCVGRQADYVDWCRKSGVPTGTGTSRASYLQEVFKTGGGVAWGPDIDPWHLGVISMASHSEPLKSMNGATNRARDAVGGAVGNLYRWMASAKGTFRVVTAAARFYDSPKDSVWDAAVSMLSNSEQVLTYNNDHLTMSYQTNSPSNRGPLTTVASNAVMLLGAQGYGLLSVLHLNDDGLSLRMWALENETVTAITTDEAREKLDLADPGVLASGWPR